MVNHNQPEKRLKIATAQIRVESDCRENFREIAAMVAMAAKKGARLLHLPEGALSGYIKTQIKSWDEVDWALIDQQIDLLCCEAKRHAIWLVVGCNRRLPFPYRPCNSLLVISDKGEILAGYDKRFISATELKHWYTPGQKPVVFSLDGFCFGLCLCIEINFPELIVEYAKMGVDAILCSSYSENPDYRILAQAHAKFGCVWFSLAVPAQVSRAMPSLIFAPDGTLLARGRKGCRSLLIAELDQQSPNLQQALTRAKPWRSRARSSGFYEPHFFYEERPGKKS